MSELKTETSDIDPLIELAIELRHDPLGFVLGAFEWGKGELAEFDGPDEWARDVLEEIGARLRAGEIDVQEAIQIAIASGHGIGKSALVAWLIMWGMATFEDTKGVVTANTEKQLITKTWAELAKWFRLCMFKHWFHLSATAIFSKDKEHEKTWRIDMIPWSEKNTEAFAGLHNKGKRILLIFDEASAIPDIIWEVSEGATTDSDTEIIWCCFGNPTKNVGRFRECFGKFRHRWFTRKVDSRSVKITNKVKLQQWEDDYGVESDFFKVRVRGEFPSVSDNALIGLEECEIAQKRHYTDDQFNYASVILGVDVARQGSDSSVIAKRQGIVLYPLKSMKIPDTMMIANQVSIEIDECKADGVFVDATGGYGVGVIDSLRNTRYSPIEVYFNGKATDPRYFNKRSEMYFMACEWIRKGGALPPDSELAEELTAHFYTFQGDKFRLCDKDDVKELIGRSPDKADAFVLTFAFPVAPRPHPLFGRTERSSVTARREYNPYGIKR